MRRAITAAPALFGASARNASTFSTVLLSELKDETGRSDLPAKPDAIPGWTLKSNPGSQVFQLVKKYNDEEIIVKSSFLTREPAAEGEDNQLDGETEIRVVKNGKEALVMAAEVILVNDETSELAIQNLAHTEDVAILETEKASELYTGPVMGDLPEEVTNAMMEYLEERGINDSLAEHIRTTSDFLEQQAYENWLSKVAEFSK